MAKEIDSEKNRAIIQWAWKNRQRTDGKNITVRDIAKTLGVSPVTVLKWKNQNTIRKKKTSKRKSKFNQEIDRFILKHSSNKLTSSEGASCRKISKLIKKKFKISMAPKTVARHMTKLLHKPLRTKKTFVLSQKHKDQRYQFALFLQQNNIKGKDIFFTDEKIWPLHTKPNPSTEKIRFSKKNYQKYMNGDNNLYEKVNKPLLKFPPSFMVSAGVCQEGPGEIIFCIGTMDSSCYQRALSYFKEDVERLNPNLYFQQDNARCHTSKTSIQTIKNKFNNFLLNWPPNSPDLSPIEDIWAIVQGEVEKKRYSTLEQKKEALINVWNKIPKSVCHKLIEKFDLKMQYLIKTKGKRVMKGAFQRFLKSKNYRFTKKRAGFKTKWTSNTTKKIVYSDSTLREIQKRTLKNIKKEKKDYTKECENYFRDTYNIKNIFSQTYSNKQIETINKILSGKFSIQAKNEYLECSEKRRKLTKQFVKTRNMDLHQFYESLSYQQKNMLIKQGNKLPKYNSRLTTEVESDDDNFVESSASDISITDENIFSAASKQSGMILEDVNNFE